MLGGYPILKYQPSTCMQSFLNRLSDMPVGTEIGFKKEFHSSPVLVLDF